MTKIRQMRQSRLLRSRGTFTALVRMAAIALATAFVLPQPRLARAGAPEVRTDVARSADGAAIMALQNAQDLAIYALGLVGVGYQYGGTSPERGLDCSGLVRYVFQEVTGVTLPRTSREMARLGGRVAAADLRPGDLVFFNTLKSPFSHVGIYLGDNRFIHAPHRGGEVEIVAMTQNYWRKRYDGARRLFGVLPDIMPAAHAKTPSADALPGTNPFGGSGG
ncbi:MAG TPA: C40 family peptidase [Casimicrobiaceae bacterium]